MITFVQKGDFSRTNKFLEKALEIAKLGELDRYGKEGVIALESATPVESGETASSWYYTIERNANTVSIIWSNSHEVNGCNIAVILQYGHGTGTGGYVEGRDYINPAIRPIFDRIAEDTWREVIKT